jgi:hypothetical protein
MNARQSVEDAARNNAEWCDAFCRTYGIVGRFASDAWSCAERTPQFYPDAVTLVRGASAEALLAQIDAGGGCSIKDSFADLDLGPLGFEVLFDAEWLCQETTTEASPDGWSAVAGAEELETWEAAWGAGPDAPRFFRRELLANENVSILGRYDGDRVTAGAIANRSRTAIGLSNVFDVHDDLESAWRDGARAARARLGPMPVVGYGSGDSLCAARRAGFAEIGSLAVWIKRK